MIAGTIPLLRGYPGSPRPAIAAPGASYGLAHEPITPESRRPTGSRCGNGGGMETTDRFPHRLGNLAQTARFPHFHEPMLVVISREERNGETRSRPTARQTTSS